MVLIRFTDTRGMEWEVWEVGVRAAPADLHPSLAPRQGGGRAPERWLCFASATERRRLAAYPERWHTMSPSELDGLCRAATPARPTPAPRPPSIEASRDFPDAGA